MSKSILRLTNLYQIFDAEEKSGEHYTNFYFTSPLSSNLELLGKNSNLELSTKIKDGNFNNKITKLFGVILARKLSFLFSKKTIYFLNLTTL